MVNTLPQANTELPQPYWFVHRKKTPVHLLYPLLAANKRIQKEVQELTLDGMPTENVGERLWRVTINGPDGSPYCDDTITFTLAFPREYPFKPPSLTVASRVYHSELSEGIAVWVPEWSPQLRVRDIMKRMKELLMLPLCVLSHVPEKPKLQQYLADPDQYFRSVAQFHNYKGGISDEVLTRWKKPQEEASKIARKEVISKEWEELKNRIGDLTWTTQTHYLFTCPYFQQTVWTILCINTHYYGAPNCLLGIPKPLVLEILTYVANDFFDEENFNQLKITDLSWMQEMRRKIRTCVPPPHLPGKSRPEKITLFGKTLAGKTTTFEAFSNDTIKTVKEILQEETRFCLHALRLVWAGKILEDHMTLEDYSIGHHSIIHIVTSMALLRGTLTFWRNVL